MTELADVPVAGYAFKAIPSAGSLLLAWKGVAITLSLGRSTTAGSSPAAFKNFHPVAWMETKTAVVAATETPSSSMLEPWRDAGKGEPRC